MIKVVVLVITVWNTSDGTKLYDETSVFDAQIAAHVNRIEACRRFGVLRAYDLTEEYKAKGHAWASTNVDCHWEERPGQGA